MLSRLLFYALLFLSVVSCSDDIDGLFPDPLNPSQRTFNGSLFIEIKDPSGQAVKDVVVNLGDANGLSDEQGILYMNNVRLGGNSYLTVSKNGYFHGSRRFYPTENGGRQIVRITLIPATTVGTFSASTGGVIQKDQATIHFPSNVYVTSDGNPYDGEVTVSMYSIAGDDPDLSLKMPGDLIGINLEGETGALASMGMVAVEMRSSSGQLLKIKEGSKVELRMKVAASQLLSAHATIPMWYFDEANGIWKEEGYANLINDEYITEVSHFSFWNWDEWFPLVNWKTSIFYEDGSPASYIRVCLTVLSMNATKCAVSDEFGIVQGRVPTAEVMQLKVPDQCGEIAYEGQVGPYSSDGAESPITISSSQIYKITGVALNCTGGPVQDGYAVLNLDNTNHYITLNGSSGEFSSTYLNCAEADPIITIINPVEDKHSIALQFPIAPEINVGTIHTCNDLNEYITFKVTGFEESIVFDTIFMHITEDQYSFISAGDDSLSHGRRVMFSFPGEFPGEFHDSWAFVYLELSPEINSYSRTINLSVTEYGPVGGYIRGHLSGHLTKVEDETVTYPFIGSFAVLRK